MFSIKNKENRGFSLSKFYSDLHKVQNTLNSTKSPSLRKDYSYASFNKQNIHHIQSQHYKTKKYIHKYKSYPQHKTYQTLLSLQSSLNYQNNQYYENSKSIQYDLPKNQDKQCQGKQTKLKLLGKIVQNNAQEQATVRDQKYFLNSCQKIYGKTNQLEQLTNEISLRDQLFLIVVENFNKVEKQKIPFKLQQFLSKYKLMSQIIQQFVKISQLNISDLNQLYYFLKTDR